MFTQSKILDIGYPQHVAIDEEYLYLAKGNELSKIELGNWTVCQSIVFAETIDSLLMSKDEIIVYFSSKSKRVGKNDLILIDDPTYDDLIPYQIIPSGSLQLVSVGEDIFDRHCGVYDLKARNMLWVNGNVCNPIIVNGQLFANVYDKVEHFDLNTGSFIWSQSVANLGQYYFLAGRSWKEGELYRFLGVYSNELWIVLTNGMLVGIDVSEGKVLHQIAGPSRYTEDMKSMKDDSGHQVYHNRNSVLDSASSKIFNIQHVGYTDANFDWYFEVDLSETELEVSVEKIENTTKAPFNIDGGPSPLFPFDDEFIYTCNFREKKIALFNRKTKIIEWVYQINVEKESFITKMEVVGNRWYIMDYSKNLFVFERTVKNI